MKPFKTLELVVGMPKCFKETHHPSLLVMVCVLVDLLISSKGLALQPSELSDHISAETEGFLDTDWYEPLTQDALRQLYDVLQDQVWPMLKEHQDVALTTVVTQATTTAFYLRLKAGGK